MKELKKNICQKKEILIQKEARCMKQECLVKLVNVGKSKQVLII